MSEPSFDHDCQACTYLGSYWSDSSTDAPDADLYVCEGVIGPTIIARHSSEVSDYVSAPFRYAERSLSSVALRHACGLYLAHRGVKARRDDGAYVLEDGSILIA